MSRPLRQQICELMAQVGVPVTSPWLRTQLNCDGGPLSKEITRMEHNRQLETVGEIRPKGKATRLLMLRTDKELSVVEHEAVKYWINQYIVDACTFLFDGHAELLVEVVRGACEDSLLMPDTIRWFDSEVCHLYMSLLVEHHEYAIEAWKRIAYNVLKEQ